MTRVNRPDTLFTQLREIERRLRLLEGRRAATLALTSVAPQAFPVPFVPAREQDWPGTDSPEWTDLLRAIAAPGRCRVVLDAVADTGTSGLARLVVNGTPTGDEVPVDDLTRHILDADVGDGPGEIVVQARRVSGDGAVRLNALLDLSRTG
jgi:hypothetical protein